jgi:hypothetical protein
MGSLNREEHNFLHDLHIWNKHVLSKYTLKYLEESIIPVCMTYPEGRTELNNTFLAACDSGDIELVSLLLWKTIDDGLSESSNSILDYKKGLIRACCDCRSEVVKLLLEHYCVNINDYESLSRAFWLACHNRNINIVQYFFDMKPLFVKTYMLTEEEAEIIMELKFDDIMLLSRKYNFDIVQILTDDTIEDSYNQEKHIKCYAMYKNNILDIISQVVDRDAANYCIEFI